MRVPVLLCTMTRDAASGTRGEAQGEEEEADGG